MTTTVAGTINFQKFDPEEVNFVNESNFPKHGLAQLYYYKTGITKVLDTNGQILFERDPKQTEDQNISYTVVGPQTILKRIGGSGNGNFTMEIYKVVGEKKEKIFTGTYTYLGIIDNTLPETVALPDWGGYRESQNEDKTDGNLIFWDHINNISYLVSPAPENGKSKILQALDGKWKKTSEGLAPMFGPMKAEDELIQEETEIKLPQAQ